MDTTAAELSRLLGPLRRALLRATRSAEGLPDLPEAQIELLRVLADAGRISPRDAAARLRVAPSTVSNLVRTATAAGLVERTASSADLRTVELSPTPTALHLLGRYDRTSAATLAEAVARLGDDDARTITQAVPVLGRLLGELERGGGAPA
jgi:DNA-binding MarR family transcriptional regulator